MDKFSQVGADRRFKSVEKSKKFNAAKEDRFNKYSKKKSLKDPRTKFDYKSHLLASKAKSEVNLKSDEDDDSEEDSPDDENDSSAAIEPASDDEGKASDDESTDEDSSEEEGAASFAKAGKTFSEYHDDELASESSSDDSTSEDEEEEETSQFYELDRDAEWDNDDNQVEVTNRIAVCNLDWKVFKANDIFLALKSFSEGGEVTKVSIYMSEYGKEKLKEEQQMGPAEIKKMQKIEKEAEEKLVEVDDDLENYELIRQYHINKLKNYYAVVEVDNVQTATSIYSQMDGMSFPNGSTLDLRYIPTGMTFEDEPVSSTGGESAQGYSMQGIATGFQAINQSRPRMTWDDQDARRTENLRSMFDDPSKVSQNVLEELMAPASDSEEDSEEESESDEYECDYKHPPRMDHQKVLDLLRDELQEDSKPKPAKKKPRVVIANVNSDDSSDDSEGEESDNSDAESNGMDDGALSSDEDGIDSDEQVDLNGGRFNEDDQSDSENSDDSNSDGDENDEINKEIDNDSDEINGYTDENDSNEDSDTDQPINKISPLPKKRKLLETNKNHQNISKTNKKIRLETIAKPAGRNKGTKTNSQNGGISHANKSQKSTGKVQISSSTKTKPNVESPKSKKTKYLDKKRSK